MYFFKNDLWHYIFIIKPLTLSSLTDEKFSRHYQRQIYQEKLGTQTFVIYQTPVFTGHCYTWGFHLTPPSRRLNPHLSSSWLNGEIVGVISKMVASLWRARVVGSGLSEKISAGVESEWLFGMLRELLYEMDLELVSSGRPQAVKLISAPEVCSLSLETQPEGRSATCKMQQGFCEWQWDQGMDTISINNGA